VAEPPAPPDTVVKVAVPDEKVAGSWQVRAPPAPPALRTAPVELHEVL
jgi:hypothetical protein